MGITRGWHARRNLRARRRQGECGRQNRLHQRRRRRSTEAATAGAEKRKRAGDRRRKRKKDTSRNGKTCACESQTKRHRATAAKDCRADCVSSPVRRATTKSSTRSEERRVGKE